MIFWLVFLIFARIATLKTTNITHIGLFQKYVLILNQNWNWKGKMLKQIYNTNPLCTGRKLNLNLALWRNLGPLNVLYTFKLLPIPKGLALKLLFPKNKYLPLFSCKLYLSSTFHTDFTAFEEKEWLYLPNYFDVRFWCPFRSLR